MLHDPKGRLGYFCLQTLLWQLVSQPEGKRELWQYGTKELKQVGTRGTHCYGTQEPESHFKKKVKQNKKFRQAPPLL